MSQKPSDTETTEAMLKALRERYPRPEWAFMTEVPNGTGAKASRRADAIAFNLFPSKGNIMICFEIKASKSDLQKELSDGSKSNAIGKFADYFFLVCPDGIIDDSILLPKTWGVLTYKNSKLRQTKKPVSLEPTQMDNCFVAALLQSLVRENDYKIECMNHDIDQIVVKRTQEQLKDYTKYRVEELQRVIAQQKEELKLISDWRDAMRKCYGRVYDKATNDLEFEPLHRSYKSLDEIINDSNFVDDIAAFIHLRKHFTDNAMYTMDSISYHTKMLEDSMNKMKQIFSLQEE